MNFGLLQHRSFSNHSTHGNSAAASPDGVATAALGARNAQRSAEPQPTPSNAAGQHSSGAQQLANRAARNSASQAPPCPKLVASRLEAYRASYAGPYQVDGQRIQVDPQFRMIGGFGTSPKTADRRAQEALPRDVFQKLRIQIGQVATGKADAATLVRVTQALIDAGAHRAFGSGHEAVRKMMWHHGIGMDCSGYTRGAFLASRGLTEAEGRAKYGLPSTYDGFNPNFIATFRKVEPYFVRPGDVCKLGEASESHKVIVAKHEVIASNAEPVILPGAGRLSDAFTGNGNVHLYHVDSSWGAGRDGAAKGGVGRHVWAFSETTQMWASLVNGELRFSTSGPYDYALTGFYRPRSEN